MQVLVFSYSITIQGEWIHFGDHNSRQFLLFLLSVLGAPVFLCFTKVRLHLFSNLYWLGN